MLSIEEAQKEILDRIHPMPVEQVPLDQALGRTLAEDIQSQVDHPPSDVSAMDGYAVRAIDIQSASIETPCGLTVTEQILAGQTPHLSCGAYQAAQVMTGAPLPEGADAVVPVEQTRKGAETVAILAAVPAGEYVRFRGEVMRIGENILKAGIKIRAAEIGVLALSGHADVAVRQRPKVAILVTGDELVDVGTPPLHGQIYNSNGLAIAAQVIEAGGVPIALGIARDTKEDLRHKLLKAQDADMIIVSGGVSVGEADHVKEVLCAEGGALHFWGVAVKPGYPMAFGTLAGRPFFGLPGNPVSAMVTFEQFVRPALLLAMGRDRLLRPKIRATLTESLHKKSGKCHLIRAVLSVKEGIYEVRSTGEQDSGFLTSMSLSNALIVLPETQEDAPLGTAVWVQILTE